MVTGRSKSGEVGDLRLGVVKGDLYLRIHNRSAAISLIMGGNLCRMNQNTYVEMVAGDWGFFACCFAPENNAICLEMLHCGECIK
jgi:hypothetical protein